MLNDIKRVHFDIEVAYYCATKGYGFEVKRDGATAIVSPAKFPNENEAYMAGLTEITRLRRAVTKYAVRHPELMSSGGNAA